MTFEERIKELTTPQLDRLMEILERLDGKTTRDFEELITSLSTKQPTLSKTDEDLIGARTYELEIKNFLDAKTAHVQAMEEFASGKLPKIERRRYRKPQAHTDHVDASELDRVSPAPIMQPTNAVETVAPEPNPAPSIVEPPPPPDNVVLLPTRLALDGFHSKFFHNENGNDRW